MKKIDFDASNYSKKGELEVFVNDFNALIDKYASSFDNMDSDVKKAESSIQKKESSISKLELTGEDLDKKNSEFKELKYITQDDIEELEAKKKRTTFSDSEVQKMVIDDITSEIESKKNKLTKIEGKISSIEAKIKTNNESIKLEKSELEELKKIKAEAEDSLYRSTNIVKLLENTKISFHESVDGILKSNRIVPIPSEPKEEVRKEKKIINFEEIDLDIDDDDFVIDEEDFDVEIEEPTIDKVEEVTEIENTEPEKEEMQEEVELENIVEPEPAEEDEILEQNDIDDLEEENEEESLEEKELTTEAEETSADYRSLLQDIFNKETISFDDFDTEVQEKMIENGDRVIKNVVVLTKHQIPLELTLNQSDIYYDIMPQDLNDLLNIVTVDEDGNGMGFTIDYTYYILNELAHTDVDKLIDVYNDNFMDINSKSGIIDLLKKTNSEVGNFEMNRLANIELLKYLGVTTTERIKTEYPEFVDIDNPLFQNMINLFDKDDLVDKLNSDLTLVPKVLEYWKSN